MERVPSAYSLVSESKAAPPGITLAAKQNRVSSGWHRAYSRASVVVKTLEQLVRHVGRRATLPTPSWLGIAWLHALIAWHPRLVLTKSSRPIAGIPPLRIESELCVSVQVE